MKIFQFEYQLSDRSNVYDDTYSDWNDNLAK